MFKYYMLAETLKNRAKTCSLGKHSIYAVLHTHKSPRRVQQQPLSLSLSQHNALHLDKLSPEQTNYILIKTNLL